MNVVLPEESLDLSGAGGTRGSKARNIDLNLALPPRQSAAHVPRHAAVGRADKSGGFLIGSAPATDVRRNRLSPSRPVPETKFYMWFDFKKWMTRIDRASAASTTDPDEHNHTAVLQSLLGVSEGILRPNFNETPPYHFRYDITAPAMRVRPVTVIVIGGEIVWPCGMPGPTDKKLLMRFPERS
ncbi:Glycine receptor subunit alpha-3 [Branchiostoma belcheri]|nr:Glycine receptor subunit alpha-3 [Branchiostoma belcheri]